MRLILNFLALVLLVGAFQSCVSNKKYNELLAAKEASDQALAETQALVQQLEEKNEQLTAEMEAEKARMNGEIESLRSDLNSTKSQVAQVQQKLNVTEEQLAAYKAAINGSLDKYKDSGLTLQERDGRLYINTSQPVRYGLGSSRLTSDERKAIAELADVLKNNPELKVLVEGHTDNVPFKPGMGDNWQLSTNRAMSVIRELLKNGVNADQVAAVGRGESMPASSNDTSEGRSENRRTVVLPDVNLGKIYEGNN